MNETKYQRRTILIKFTVKIMIQLHFSFSSRFTAERLAKFEVKVFKNDYILSIQCIEYTGIMLDQSTIISKYYLIFF